MELMLASSVQDEDPNEPNPVAQTTPTRPKRELIDLIPKIIDIEVETRTGVQATVSVISTWRSKSTLQIELSDDNLDLLLEEGAPRSEAEYAIAALKYLLPDQTG